MADWSNGARLICRLLRNTTEMAKTPGLGGKAGSVRLQRIYVKDISFESPRAPQVFNTRWQPQLNVHIQSQNQPLNDDLHEAQLQITITAKMDGKTVFSLDVVQAGIFELQDLSTAETEYALNVALPNALFPYAREAIDDLLVKASMPPLMLAQVDFEALYNQRKLDQKKQPTVRIKDEDQKPRIN